MVLLKFIATSIVLVSWAAKFFCFDADLELEPPTPAKWHASEEASQEIRGFQRYVAALAAYDTSVDEPVFLAAALGFGSGPVTVNASDVPPIVRADIREFFRSVRSVDAHRVVRHEPLHWRTLADLASSDFPVSPDGGWDLSWRRQEVISTGRLLGGGRKQMPRAEPAAGWCTTRHKPLKPAQSGYRGDDGLPYCKSCLQRLFPAKYSEKQARRTGLCSLCGISKEFVRGVCKPCPTVRECPECQAVNRDVEARRCGSCPERLLALWCESCTDEVARDLGLCHAPLFGP